MQILYSFSGALPFPSHLYCYLLKNANEADFEFKSIMSTSNDFEDGSIFVLHRNDIFEFEERSKDIQDKIIKCKNKIVMICHIGYSLGFNNWGTHLVNFLNKLTVKNENIYCFVQTMPDLEFVKQNFPESNCLAYDEWAHEYNLYVLKNRKVQEDILNLNFKRFGLFIRRYSKDRLNFILSILSRDLLKDFHYTFTNWKMPPPNITNDIIEKDIDNEHLVTPTLANRVKEWVNGIPYYAGHLNHDHGGEYPLEVERYIQYSQFMIIQETSAVENSPAVITEKTYKAIYHNKPFIILGQQGTLEYLRIDGYKTFHPFIDETYDNKEKYSDRVSHIIDEIERLSKLNDQEFNELLLGVEDIIKHNSKVFLEKLNRPVPQEFILENIACSQK